jgi:hypothetical protein
LSIHSYIWARASAGWSSAERSVHHPSASTIWIEYRLAMERYDHTPYIDLIEMARLTDEHTQSNTRHSLETGWSPDGRRVTEMQPNGFCISEIEDRGFQKRGNFPGSRTSLRTRVHSKRVTTKRVFLDRKSRLSKGGNCYPSDG